MSELKEAVKQVEKKFETNSCFLELMKIENPFVREIVVSTTSTTTTTSSSHSHQHNGHSGEQNGFDENDTVRDENKNILKNGGGGGDYDNNNEHDTSLNGGGHGGGLVLDKDLPILTNTTLNVIRLFGKYIHILSIFKIISHQVINYLMQLFYFYLYFIYMDFSREEVGFERV
jgi:hypothetical protein